MILFKCNVEGFTWNLIQFALIIIVVGRRTLRELHSLEMLKCHGWQSCLLPPHPDGAAVYAKNAGKHKEEQCERPPGTREVEGKKPKAS